MAIFNNFNRYGPPRALDARAARESVPNDGDAADAAVPASGLTSLLCE